LPVYIEVRRKFAHNLSTLSVLVTKNRSKMLQTYFLGLLDYDGCVYIIWGKAVLNP